MFGTATRADYQAALEREIGIHWRVMHRYRRAARRVGVDFTTADANRRAARDCRLALLVLLDVRATAKGRNR